MWLIRLPLYICISLIQEFSIFYFNCDVALAVSHWPVVTKTQVWCQAGQVGFMVDTVYWTRFFSEHSHFPCHNIVNTLYSYIIHSFTHQLTIYAGRFPFMPRIHSWRSCGNWNCANRTQNSVLKWYISWGLGDWQLYALQYDYTTSEHTDL